MSLGCRVIATIGFEGDVSYGTRPHRSEYQTRTGVIERVEIRNLKRFKEFDCGLDKHLVIVGPNSCGKTTLLQAIAFWSEIASHWAQYNSDLARDENDDYPSTNLGPQNISSIPLSSWDHLWPARDVTDPVSIRLYINGHALGFELLFRDRSSAALRPMRDVPESLLDDFRQHPFTPVYVPPMSGVDLTEEVHPPEVIRARLARGLGGTVLRNLLLRVSGDSEKWRELKGIVDELFGYELILPSAGAEILAEYREGPATLGLGYSSGASGFLQVVMMYAAILQSDGSVILIDEPDAHLHIVLQDRLYRDLRKRARRHDWQLIMATHSERVIREARVDVLRLLSDRLYRIEQPQQLVDTLELDHVELVMAQHLKRILYVEGKTDLRILRAWANALEHPLRRFLEEPFWKPMAEDKWNAKRHFKAMRLSVPGLRGVELRDRNDRQDRSPDISSPDGLRQVMWLQYEIENYLIHPAAILRWLRSIGDETAVSRAEQHMKDRFPPAIYEDPFGTDYFQRKGKGVLGEVCEAARLPVEEVEYYEIATLMRSDEIHPEVSEKLDTMAEELASYG